MSSALVAVQPALGETLYQALVSTYSNNPTLNAARAAQRAQNETINQALAGRRPTITGTTSIGGESTNSSSSGGFSTSQSSDAVTGSAGVTLTQNLFNGFQVSNNVKSAEAGVKAGVSNLQNTEQSVLQLAVTAYADVFRDRRILGLQQRNVKFSQEQLRASRAQAEVGEGTRTDVALARANVADSLSDLAGSKSSLISSEATYLQIIGTRPGKLKTATGAAKHIPSTLSAALSRARTSHPLIKAAQHNVDAGQFNVKVSEGTLLPTVSLNGSYLRSFEGGASGSDSSNSSLTANVSIPLYQGGSRFSSIRQARQTVSQLRIQVDEVRRSVEQAVRAAWAALDASKSQIRSAQTNVSASQTALNGLVEERRLGEATTLDVLNAQSNLITAQVALENARRDRLVASYALLSSIGNLTGDRLQVAKSTNVRPPKYHYKVTRDRWLGLRSPGAK
ncbi:MAG: TolC family outer membrane protein [Hyphomicrobiales bacterium]